MNLKNWFHKDFDKQRDASEISLFSNTKFDYHDYLGLLDFDLRPFADAFYEKLSLMLPKDFIYGPDKLAPEDARCDQKQPVRPYQKASLTMKRQSGARFFKYGTARVEHRQQRLFAKIVTWHTPEKFLHQRNVYDLIKQFFPDCRIMPSRSRQEKGFAIKNGKKIITLEVFSGDNNDGFLGVDIALHDANKPLAIKRMNNFLEFYGHLYNMLGNPELQFAVDPIVTDEFEIEIVEDYQDQLDREVTKSDPFG